MWTSENAGYRKLADLCPDLQPWCQLDVKRFTVALTPGPDSAPPRPDRATPTDASKGLHEPVQRRSWWQRWVGA
jgi:hypothetical protein